MRGEFKRELPPKKKERAVRKKVGVSVIPKKKRSTHEYYIMVLSCTTHTRAQDTRFGRKDARTTTYWNHRRTFTYGNSPRGRSTRPSGKYNCPHPPRMLLPASGVTGTTTATCRGSCLSAASYGLPPYSLCGTAVADDESLCPQCRSNVDPTAAKVLRMTSSEPLPILAQVLDERDPVRRNIMMLRWKTGICAASPS